MAKETIQYQELLNVVRGLSKSEKYDFFLSACENANLQICQICLDAGADINFREYLYQRTLIYELARRDELTEEVGNWLIQKGADINIADSDDRTILSRACESGNIRVAKYFIDKGIEIRQHEDEFSKPSDLYWAVTSEKYELVKILLESGVNIESDIDGYFENYNPYIQAAFDKSSEIVELFLQKGASADFALHGITPLHIATANKDIKTANILLKYNANVNVKLNAETFSALNFGYDDFVLNPMDIAMLKEDIAMQKLLTSFGGTLSTKDDKIRALTECSDKKWAMNMIRKLMS